MASRYGMAEWKDMTVATIMKAPVPMDDDTLNRLIQVEAEHEFALESVTLDYELGLAQDTMVRAYEQKLRAIMGGE